MVQILVGPDKTKFAIHRNLLCSVSDKFRATFERGWKETHDGSLKLKEDQPHIFALFKHWLYVGELHNSKPDDSLSDQSTQMGRRILGTVATVGQQAMTAEAAAEHVYRVQADLVDCYIFGQYHLIPGFQNKVMDQLIKYRASGWPLLSRDHSLVVQAFEHTSESSNLCTYIIEEAASLGPFISSTLRNLVKLVRPDAAAIPPVWRYNICHYHEHKDEKEVDICRKYNREWQDELRRVKYTVVLPAIDVIE